MKKVITLTTYTRDLRNGLKFKPGVMYNVKTAGIDSCLLRIGIGVHYDQMRSGSWLGYHWIFQLRTKKLDTKTSGKQTQSATSQKANHHSKLQHQVCTQCWLFASFLPDSEVSRNFLAARSSVLWNFGQKNFCDRFTWADMCEHCAWQLEHTPGGSEAN